MFSKIIGAIAGAKISQDVRGIGGSGGAALGVAAATIAKRLSIPALILISAGGYFAKKYFEKKEAAKGPTKTPPKVTPSAI